MYAPARRAAGPRHTTDHETRIYTYPIMHMRVRVPSSEAWPRASPSYKTGRRLETHPPHRRAAPSLPTTYMYLPLPPA